MEDHTVAASDERVDAFARRWTNLADARAGAQTVAATDQFFGPAERMLQPDPALFYPARYDDAGKWMDGWETRRRRTVGHDHCVVRLAAPGVIRAVDIDTSHFTGNFPPAALLEGCFSPDAPDEGSEWFTLVPALSLKGDAHHPVDVDDDRPCTHVRLHIYPDGGVARLRIFGRPYCDWSARDPGALHELSSLAGGGHVIAFSDSHYGNPFRILAEPRGINMGDGWETRRRREPGNDWIIIALGHPGTIERIEVDTTHFKGNFPDACSVQAALVTGGTEESLISQSMFWDTLLPETKLEMDRPHRFEGAAVTEIGPVSHARLNIHPDGGISRFRLFGRIG